MVEVTKLVASVTSDERFQNKCRLRISRSILPKGLKGDADITESCWFGQESKWPCVGADCDVMPTMGGFLMRGFALGSGLGPATGYRVVEETVPEQNDSYLPTALAHDPR